MHQQTDRQGHVQTTFRDLGLHVCPKVQLGVTYSTKGAVSKDGRGPDGVTWREKVQQLVPKTRPWP